MNEDKLQSPRHSSIRKFLCVAGPVTAAMGLLLIVIGMASFFIRFGSAFGSSGDVSPPRFFWCAFLGMPLLFVGTTMCLFGYIGMFARFIAGESAPVAKDTLNYMGENSQPGIKAVAKAVTEGIVEAQKELQRKP